MTLTPKTIGGKNVKDLFTEYVPRKSRFIEVLIIIMFLVHDLKLCYAVQYSYTTSITVVSWVVPMDARTQLMIKSESDTYKVHTFEWKRLHRLLETLVRGHFPGSGRLAGI